MGLAKLMAHSNLDSLGINFIDEILDQSEKEEVILPISIFFPIPIGIKILFMYYSIYKHLLI